MKENEQLSAAKTAYQRIKEMPLDPLYKEVPDLPIPTLNSVLIQRIKKEDNKIILLTDLGHEQTLLLAEGNNSQQPILGIIMAVGPECFDWLKPGLRCYYDCNQTGTFRHGKTDYVRMDQYGVYYIVPSTQTIDLVGVKDDRQVTRERQAERNKTADRYRNIEELNQMDKLEELKKKVRKR